MGVVLIPAGLEHDARSAQIQLAKLKAARRQAEDPHQRRALDDQIKQIEETLSAGGSPEDKIKNDLKPEPEDTPGQNEKTSGILDFLTGGGGGLGGPNTDVYDDRPPPLQGPDQPSPWELDLEKNREANPGNMWLDPENTPSITDMLDAIKAPGEGPLRGPNTDLYNDPPLPDNMDGGTPLEWDPSLMPTEEELLQEQGPIWPGEEQGPPMPVDADGIPNEPDDNPQTVKDLIEGDAARSPGLTWNPDAEHDVGRITPVDVEGKFGGKLRQKIGGFFGHDSEEELQRFGSALTGFGSGLLTGGSDFGAAMGHGFAKAQDQFVSTKKSQRQATLDDIRMARDEEKRDWEREKMNDWRAETARQRLMQKPADLLKREEYRKKGVRYNDEGDLYIDPDAVETTSKQPETLEEWHHFFQTEHGRKLLIPGETSQQAARRMMGKKLPDDALPFPVGG